MDPAKELAVILKELEFCPTGGRGSAVLPLDHPPELRCSIQIPEIHLRPADCRVCILSSIMDNFNHPAV